jgi:hypothetical protein
LALAKSVLLILKDFWFWPWLWQNHKQLIMKDFLALGLALGGTHSKGLIGFGRLGEFSILLKLQELFRRLGFASDHPFSR